MLKSQTVFDPDRQWKVDARKFLSKGRNSPWVGATLDGRVQCTLVDGRIVYREEAASPA